MTAAITPKMAILSAGKKNKFGHPHKETLDILSRARVPVMGTYEKGDVEVVTDGVSWWITK